MEIVKVAKTASRGIAIAPIYKFETLDLLAENYAVEQVEEEIQKFLMAREQVKKDLSQLAKTNEIFSAHLELADDIILQEEVEHKIRTEQQNAQQAVEATIQQFATIFSAMEDDYMKERADDIQDIGKRIMAKLKKVVLPDLSNITEDVIVVAKDLFPSDTAKMNPQFIKGLIMEEGGITSHVSIMAKNLDIPTLVGVTNSMEKAKQGTIVCMNATEGTIVFDPEEETIARYRTEQQDEAKRREYAKSVRERSVITKSGKTIALCANVGNLHDIELALEKNIDGVGLFRSEFLYMENDHFPTEQEQFQVYKKAIELCPKEMTIRTLDIGGDKGLPYFQFEKEENPFLGWRAIRICLEKKELFQTQLRALLRASAFGPIRIMFPMIISLEELRQAKAIVEQCKEELRTEQVTFNEKIEIGMMIETPASVLLAEEFAKEVDFFSIGTNDLTQYLLVVDRGNKKVADRYNYLDRAVLKAIKQVIEAGHKQGIPVGMCGEMASDEMAIPILLSYGLDEFSMSIGMIDDVRAKMLQIIEKDTSEIE